MSHSRRSPEETGALCERVRGGGEGITLPDIRGVEGVGWISLPKIGVEEKEVCCHSA